MKFYNFGYVLNFARINDSSDVQMTVKRILQERKLNNATLICGKSNEEECDTL